MTIQSPIGDLGLLDLFQLIYHQQKTGRLIITDGPNGNEAWVLFSGGAIGLAAVCESFQESMLPLLVKWNVLTEEQGGHASKALSEYQTLVDCLAGENLVPFSYLKNVIAKRTQESVYEMFKWTSGTCRFTEVSCYDERAVILVPLNTENMILEGARRIDELENIKSKVPSPHSVFRLRPSDEEEQKLNLKPKEWEILSLLDGVCSVAEASESVSCDLFTTSKLIYGLVLMNVIELVENEGGAGSGEDGAEREVDKCAERGRVFYDKGDLEQAASEFEKAMQIEPDCFEAMRMLGEIYYKLGRLDEALIYLKKTRRVKPEHEKAIFIIGQLHARMGDVASAIKAWEELRGKTSKKEIADMMDRRVDIAKQWEHVLQEY
jgi:tetratricopeptide (TPR) repeat protein